MFVAARRRIELHSRSGSILNPSRLITRLVSNLGIWAFSLILLLLTSTAWATSVKLAWDASTDAQLAGYKVYYGYASRQYSASVNVGTATTAAFSSLQDAQMYYFTTTAYDVEGNESTFSNEVSYDLAQVDSDRDGLSDWDEINLYRTDPHKADTDGDGLSDWEEIMVYKTDPLNADTDGDGVPDGEEVKRGSDPLDANSTPTQSTVPFGVNAGGPQYIATNDNVYQADTMFTGGSTYTTTAAIASTADPSLYQSERFGNFSYAMTLDNGDYLVTLRFAEIYWSSVGQRIFDVDIEGVEVIHNLDLVAQVGPNVAYNVVIPVRVTDGVLDIVFRSVVNHAKVSAIEISPATDTPKTPSAWSNYVVSLKMWSNDDDAIGVMFRYQDGNNYYRFSWDKERGYRRLVKQQAGTFTLLAEDAVPYVPGRIYQVAIVADGAMLEVWIDGARIFAVADASLREGSIAMYTWFNWGSYFDDVIVTDLDTNAVLLSADFNDGKLTDWTIVDDGKSAGPSAWSVDNGALLQNSDIYTNPTNRQNITKLGTYAVYTSSDSESF